MVIDPNSWISNSRATKRMIGASNFFTSCPCAGKDKVRVTDVFRIPIKGHVYVRCMKIFCMFPIVYY